MAHIGKEKSQTLPQVRLKAHIFRLKAIHELRVFPGKAAQMSEIDIECLLLFSLELLRKLLIVADLRVRLVFHVSIRLVVGVVRAQHKP